MRLVQLQAPSRETRVAIVGENQLPLLKGTQTIGDLGQSALSGGVRLADAAAACAAAETLPYDSIYRLESDWRLLPAFSHPEPARCLVTGTGLTHKASADNRQAMHHNPEELSD